jgi:hypothetical protein
MRSERKEGRGNFRECQGVNKKRGARRVTLEEVME